MKEDELDDGDEDLYELSILASRDKPVRYEVRVWCTT